MSQGENRCDHIFFLFLQMAAERSVVAWVTAHSPIPVYTTETLLPRTPATVESPGSTER